MGDETRPKWLHILIPTHPLTQDHLPMCLRSCFNPCKWTDPGLRESSTLLNPSQQRVTTILGTASLGAWRLGLVTSPTCLDHTTATRYQADTDSPSTLQSENFEDETSNIQ